ncbi:histidinol-phosphate transaminase [Ochrobactrum vermis]|uniref:Histidinol-phosphate aminotransferase n=1 Tax=Ochrobactrum vermis TaxID=1827297 RepID=A0ABU8PKZ2_9HYPH|nr:histidinol-phosphate transaminase [Ochrobactrum vermis]PQZ24317.1 histidinol-phosphate transaminase [Ochrobactrum vermis]
MSRFWSPHVATLTPYKAGEQPADPDVLKLNTNENPYGPSPRAIAAIALALDQSLGLYPEPTAMRFRLAVAQHHGVDPAEVFVGNGSDEVLAHTFQALLNHQRPLLFPDITYSFYRTYCALYGIAFVEVPLDRDFRIRVEGFRRPCGAIILANPNTPTGIAMPLADIETLCSEHGDQVVVIDEAYVAFGAESAIPLTRTCPNLLVVQTLSKSHGLAGLRVGFAVGQAPLIQALERVRDSFNSYPVDRLAQAGAVAAWEDREWFERHRDLIIENREYLGSALREAGFEVLSSAANFLFARHPKRDGAELAAALKSRGAVVRHFPGVRTGNYLRISIGSRPDCDRLLATMADILD